MSSADKPEAGRTCAVWCGGGCDGRGDPCFNGTGNCYCTKKCRAAGKPLNPAPRPVEPLYGVDADLRGLEEASDAAYERDHPPRPVERATMHCLTCGGPCDGPCEEGDEQFRQESQPCPVERCSCEESQRYKAALEQLLADVKAAREWSGGPVLPRVLNYDYIERIARRALALGGET